MLRLFGAVVTRYSQGLWCTGSGLLVVSDASFVDNSGLAVAGAIATTNDCSMIIQRALFLNNTSSTRGSVILAFVICR